jgi:PncC family amidohydrolase
MRRIKTRRIKTRRIPGTAFERTIVLGIEKKAGKAAAKLVEELSGRLNTVAFAESCTAGLVSDLMARVSGASAALWGSFVCYSPEAKKRMLCIDGAFLEKHGLVSAETAGKMALNALDIADVDFAAAVTGLAGPLGDGDTARPPMPVGTVFIAVARRVNGDAAVNVKPFFFRGTRAEIRMQAAKAVIDEVIRAMSNEQ